MYPTDKQNFKTRSPTDDRCKLFGNFAKFEFWNSKVHMFYLQIEIRTQFSIEEAREHADISTRRNAIRSDFVVRSRKKRKKKNQREMDWHTSQRESDTTITELISLRNHVTQEFCKIQKLLQSYFFLFLEPIENPSDFALLRQYSWILKTVPQSPGTLRLSIKKKKKKKKKRKFTAEWKEIWFNSFDSSLGKKYFDKADLPFSQLREWPISATRQNRDARRLIFQKLLIYVCTCNAAVTLDI